MAGHTDFIRSLYEAFGRGDAETVLGALHPEVEWNEAEGQPYASGNPYVGPQRVGEEVFGRIMGDFDDFQVNPQTYVAEGDHVVAMGRYTATRKGSGEPLDAQFAHHWRVEDGQVVAFQQYVDTGQMRDILD